MSAINHKSITGITSITTPAGVDNFFTVHSNDTTERFRVDQSGNQNISGIVTATNFKSGSSNLHSTGLTVGDTFVHATGVNGSSADIDDFISVGSNIHLGNAGIVTATNFVKADGSAVGGVTSDAQQNTVGGTNAGDSFSGTSAIQNTLYGFDAGTAITSADGNIAIGYEALEAATTGSYNVAIGRLALDSCNTDNNVAIGDQGGYGLTSGQQNTFLGARAGKNITNGSNNTCIGVHMGTGLSGNASNNILLGHGADPSSATISNEVTIGNSSITKFRIPGINVVLKDNGGTPTQGHVLTVDGSGEASFAAVAGGVDSDAQQNTIGGANAGNSFSGTSATNNTLFGSSAGRSVTSGDDNTFYGIDAGRDTTTGSQNTAIGPEALRKNTQGAGNVAIGNKALFYNTTSHANVAVGKQALYNNTTGYYNVSIGVDSLKECTTGHSNTAVGAEAATDLTTSYAGTFIGFQAGHSNTTGSKNTIVGYEAFEFNTTGHSNVAMGYRAIQQSNSSHNNVAIGDDALKNTNTGYQNVAVGAEALTSNTSSHNNIAIGYEALKLSSNSNANYNTVIGGSSLKALTQPYHNLVIGYECASANSMTGGTPWHGNVILGYQAGNMVPAASSNIAIGKLTCNNAGSGMSDSIVMGQNAGKNLGNNSSNIVVLGQEAAQNAGYGSGSNHGYSFNNCVAIGYRAMRNATGAPISAIAMGSHALAEHTGDGDGSSGGYIVAVGNNAAEQNRHIRHSVIIGNSAATVWNAAKSAQHEGGCVFIGGGAGRTVTTGNALIAIGRDSLAGGGACTSQHNTAIGSRCLERLTSGSNNCAVGGLYTGLMLTTGDYNNFFGSLAGYAYNVNTGATGDHNNIFGGYSAASGNNDHENIFGGGLTGKGANTTYIRGSCYQSTNSSSWYTTSDQRIKKNIVDNNIGLDAIEKIRVRNFEYRTKDEITDFDNTDAVVVKKEGVQLGVIAQEIKDILPDIVTQNTTGAYAVDPDNLTWYLVNAVKELSAEVKSLKAQLNS